MAGREVVENGLPHTEHLTVLGEGRTWTDQQWLAQVIFYAAHELAGHARRDPARDRVRAACAGPRVRGGTSRRRVVPLDVRRRLPRDPCRPLGLDAPRTDGGPACFAAALWLLVDASRNGTRRRTLIVLPLFVLWANLHGSVVLGAGLAMLLGIVELVRARRLAWIPLALLVLSPLCVLATPYGWDIVAYYKLMLVDAPFAPILREWQWSSPSGTTALFWLLALVAAGILALRRCRSRLTFYELAVLVLTFAGAVQAVRGVIWFALAAAAILPVALDGLLTKADVAAPQAQPDHLARRPRRPCGRALAFVARPASWFVSEWPEARVAAVREATRDPNVRVWATDGTADWLLWRLPELRGRLAYDVRFELYDQPTLDRIVYYGRRQTGWKASLDDYRSCSWRTRSTSARSPRSPARGSSIATRSIAVVVRG